MLRAQLGQGDVLADLDVQVEVDAAFLELLPAAEHDILLQLEVGDAVDHQPADAVVAVIDMHLVAAHPQPFRRREAGGAGADDADGLRELTRRLGRLHPAILPGRVGDVLLDRADGDAAEILLDDAIAFAQAVLGADAAADLGEGIGGGGHLIGFLQPAFGGQLQPVGDVVVQRAMHLAEGHAALAAPAGLGFRGVRFELPVDLGEILAPGGRLALLGRALVETHELQHPVGHGGSRLPGHGETGGECRLAIRGGPLQQGFGGCESASWRQDRIAVIFLGDPA